MPKNIPGIEYKEFKDRGIIILNKKNNKKQ